MITRDYLNDQLNRCSFAAAGMIPTEELSQIIELALLGITVRENSVRLGTHLKSVEKKP